MAIIGVAFCPVVLWLSTWTEGVPAGQRSRYRRPSLTSSIRTAAYVCIFRISSAGRRQVPYCHHLPACSSHDDLHPVKNMCRHHEGGHSFKLLSARAPLLLPPTTFFSYLASFFALFLLSCFSHRQRVSMSSYVYISDIIVSISSSL